MLSLQLFYFSFFLFYWMEEDFLTGGDDGLKVGERYVDTTDKYLADNGFYYYYYYYYYYFYLFIYLFYRWDPKVVH